MHTLSSICRLCLLLLVVKTLAQDHRLRTPDSDGHRTRRKPKWSHFFVMHEPRSEEKDNAQGFFYQVGSGPPVINRLRSSPSGFQSQAERNNMARYNPVLHSPYPNRRKTHQQFGPRTPDSFGARMANLPNPSLLNKEQAYDSAGGTFNSEMPPDNTQNFESGLPGAPEQQENFPENQPAPLHFEEDTLGDVDSKSGTEVLGAQGVAPSHATLLHQRSREYAGVPDDSSKASPVSVKTRPSFVVGGQTVFGKKKPLPSHLTPIIPPGTNQPEGESSIADNSDHEREKLRLSIAQHIPTRIRNIRPVLDQDNSGRGRSGLGVYGPDSSAVRLLGGNRESQFLGTEIPKSEVASKNDKLEQGGIINVQNGYGKESNHPEGNLNEREKLSEQSGISGWQSQPQLNPQSQEGAPEIFFSDPGNGREREPISHDFAKPPYQTQQPNSPHLTPLKYNYLPVSQQHAQTDNGYKPPSLVNFNTNIHLHGGSPASPNADFQQERPKQASHSLSVHPYVLQRPGSEVLQPTLQKDVQTSGDFGGRIPSSQIYLLRPSNGPDLPLVITGHQNGPYRQDKRQHFFEEANLRTSQTPSHLTAILPVSLGNSKENAGQRVPQNIFISNAKERTPNIEYSDLLLRNQPQDGVAPSANPATNTATHSIRLLLPQQQLPRYSPTDVPSGAQNVVSAPNRFQTHQVNLLPNSHGYVQTQVQLPPLNFRFQLTPVKDDSNGTFGDSSDSQKAQPNFQPIPYQYQFPLQPVPIQGTHQILFPNLQIANVPLGTSTVPSDETLVSTAKSIEVQSNLPEKSEPVTVPSVVENAADIGGGFKDQDISNKGIHESTEDHIPVTTITNDETSVDGKSKVLETASLPNDISVEEGVTEKDTKEDTAIKFFTPIEDKTMEKSRTESKNADIQLSSSIGHSEDKEEIEVASEDDSKLELTTKSQFSSRKPILDLLSVLTFTEAPKTEDVTKILSEGVKPVEGKRGTTSADLESSSLSTGDSDDKSSSELSTTVSNAPTTISTRESNTLEQSEGDLDDKGRSELSTTTAKVPATVSIKESTTLQLSTKDLTDKSSNELSTTVSEVLETTTLKQAAGDLDDKDRSELSTTTAKVPTTVSIEESTTLQQSTKDLTDKSNNELSTTVSEAPETTTLEQSAGDLADKSNGELSTSTSKVPTTVSITESTTLEQSTGDLADKSNNELSTRTSEAPTTLGMTESTPLEQSTEDSVDKSRGELSTTASGVPTTISSGESTVLEQDHTSTTEKEVNTDDVSDSSDSPRDISDEDSTVSNTSTTSTVTEHMLSSESPADPSFTTTNVSPSTDATTTTVARINDMSSVSTVAETVRELSETTSTSTISALQTSTESIPPITVRGTATHSTAETSVPLTEASATTFLEEIMTTATSTSAETEENNLNADRPLKTELNVSTQISKQEELKTVTASVNNSELNQPGTEASQTPTSTGSSSLPDIFSTSATVNASETDAANEIEQFFTSPDAESSTVSSPKIPFTTDSSGDKFRVFDKLSVFTFTEAPVSQRKLEKTNGGAKGLTPEENSKGSGTQSDIKEIEQTKKVENGRSDTNVVSTSVTKNSEASLNEIFVVSTTTQGVQDAKDEEGNKRSREGILKEINETSLEPKLKTAKQPDDRAIFTFVGNTVSEATGDKKEIPSGVVTSSTPVSTEDNKVDQFTEKVTETVLDHEIPTSTLNTETESNQNQGRAVGNSDSKNLTSDTAQDFTGVLNGREKNENEVPVVEIGRSSKQNTTEYGSDPEVSTGTEIIVLYDKETNDESENEQTSSATIETQNTPTLSSEAPKSNDRGSFVISDSETTVESKSSDSPIFKTTTNDTGNNRVSGSSDSRDVPMIIDNDAMELLLNNLVKPKNISIIEPVTSTSISISIGIPTESPEQILDEDKAQLPENTLTGQNSDVLGTRNTSVTAVQNEDNTNLPASENGSNFFSKVFGKSLLPFNNDNQNSPEDSLSGVKTSEDGSRGVSTLPEEKPRKESTQENIQDHSVKTSSPLPSTEAPSSFSETQVTSTSISPETEMPISDLSAVKLSVFENFEGKDVPDFTEILKQHAR